MVTCHLELMVDTVLPILHQHITDDPIYVSAIPVSKEQMRDACCRLVEFAGECHHLSETTVFLVCDSKAAANSSWLNRASSGVAQPKRLPKSPALSAA